eukprot:gene3639-6217_t
MDLGELTVHNVKQLKLINQIIFPVSYSDKFYKDVVNAGEYAKLAYLDDVVVGAVCCRHENNKIYIMTLGCLAPYRRLGLGRMMLEHVLRMAKKKKNDSVFLHVHVENEEAIAFYKSFGFDITKTIQGYYKKLSPGDAHVLTKTVLLSKPAIGSSENSLNDAQATKDSAQI